MVATPFHHGVDVIEVSDGIRPIRVTRSSVIGLIGTAPQADTAKFPLNTPVLIPGNPRMAADLGQDGTIPRALDAIFDHIGAVVIVVRVEEGTGADAAARLPRTVTNMIGDAALGTGVHAFKKAQSLVGYTPRILIAPEFTSYRPINGVNGINLGTGGSGYDRNNPPAVTITRAAGDTTGVGASARAVVNAGGQVAAVVIQNGGHLYTAVPTVTIDPPASGAQATATATVGVYANPVVAELKGLAERMRAVIFADAPDTTYEDALAYRMDWASDRIYVIHPGVMYWDAETSGYKAGPASARFAGVQAKVDHEKGFWWSVSNKELNGIGGPSRSIDFYINDSNCEANLLNEQEIATIVRHHTGGFHTWGNRTTAADPLWAFLSVRRTADMIYEAMEREFVWAVDRPGTPNNILEVVESGNAFIRSIRAAGGNIDGRVWFDPALNEPTDLMAGKYTFDFDFEPFSPMEHIRWRAHRNPEYWREVTDAVARAIAG